MAPGKQWVVRLKKCVYLIKVVRAKRGWGDGGCRLSWE